MKELKIKDCPLCGKIIWKFKRNKLFDINKFFISINLKKVPYAMNEHGDHFWILLTNGSRMRVAICKDCKPNLSDKKVRRILSDVVYGNLRRLEKRKDDERKYDLFDHYRLEEVFKWFNSEEELVLYLENYNGKNNKPEKSKIRRRDKKAK